jgi:hypothetical protein
LPSFGDFAFLAGQSGDEWVGLRDHEGSLSRTRLYQPEGGEPLDGVADGVPRGLVVLPQLDLGSQLLTGLDLAGLDLLTQVVGDLPVHGIRHRPSSLVPRAPVGLILLIRTAWTICLSRIFGIDKFIPKAS